jgi:hypothetical protein
MTNSPYLDKPFIRLRCGLALHGRGDRGETRHRNTSRKGTAPRKSRGAARMDYAEINNSALDLAARGLGRIDVCALVGHLGGRLLVGFRIALNDTARRRKNWRSVDPTHVATSAGRRRAINLLPARLRCWGSSPSSRSIPLGLPQLCRRCLRPHWHKAARPGGRRSVLL